MKTLADSTRARARAAAPALFTRLKKMGFVPGKWDAEQCRIFDMNNATGHPIARVAFHMSGNELEYASVVFFNGTKAQLITWELSTIPAQMPTETLIAIIIQTLNA